MTGYWEVSADLWSLGSVDFRSPGLGSYTQTNNNGYRTYVREQNGSCYLDLWVKKMPQWCAPRPEVFARPGRKLRRSPKVRSR